MEEKYTKKVTIREIVDFFKFEQLTGDENSLDRWTVVPDVNRPGFELCGFYKRSDPRRIIIIGNKETEFIRTMTEEEQRARFPMITDGYTPMIIITKNNELPPILKEIAEKQNFPILRTSMETYRLVVDLVTYLDERLAREDTISGTLMSVYGVGVLITGESGMGKGLLEIRGIGIIDVEKMFGASALNDRSPVDMVINLVKFRESDEYNRIGDETMHYTKILDVLVPTVVLPVSAGRNMRILVESAVTNFRLQKDGFSSSRAIKDRFRMYCGKEE